MRAQGPGALHEEQLGAAGAEEDEHGGLPPAAVLGRQEAAQLPRLDGPGRLDDGIEPTGQTVGGDGRG
ncbi:hypothetical protein, partial [Streptomyces avidinii]